MTRRSDPGVVRPRPRHPDRRRWRPPSRRQAPDGARTRTRPPRRDRSAKTSGWSHSAPVRMATDGRYGSKLPAYSSASTTKRATLAATRGRRQPTGDALTAASAPTNADGSAPAPTRTWTSQPDVVLLPWVPATATSVAIERAVRDDLLPRFRLDADRAGGSEFRVVGIDRGERLGHGHSLGSRCVGDVGRIVGPGERDPGLVERRRVR